MKYERPEVLIAFESAKPGERVEIWTEGSSWSNIGHVVEKKPYGYYDEGWCITIKVETVVQDGQVAGGWLSEIFRENIISIYFLYEEDDVQLLLPFDEVQPHLLVV
ncbi:MAG: hypothetical protein WC657_00570 [Candidatus Paceibacterota bacterium]|jgi:hypothetical protein